MSAIKLSQLEVLIAAVESGSFSSAAAELDCTQSRVSHAISQLERRVGARLLVRTRTGCSLTGAGVHVLATARQVVKLTNSIEASVRDQCVGRVRLASLRCVATHLLPYAAQSLTKKHPKLSIEICDGCETYEDVAASIEAGRADIGITHPSGAPRMLCIPYVCDAYVLVVPADADLNDRPAWEDLSHLRLLQLAHPACGSAIERFRAYGFAQQPSSSMSNESSILHMVARGLGYTLLPRLATLPDLAGTRIIRPPVHLAREFSIVVAPSTADSPLIRTVVAALRDADLVRSTEAWRLGAISWQ